MYPLIVALIAAAIIAIVSFLWRKLFFGGRGDKIEIKGLKPGDVVTIQKYDYQDGVPDSPVRTVRDSFQKARDHLARDDFHSAIKYFKEAIESETDPERKGALHLQIGNALYTLRLYDKAMDSYTTALKYAKQGGDLEGEASALGSIANTYLDKPASDVTERGENVRTAVKNYIEALKIFTVKNYTVQYAMTQNNLGTAYTYLPSATPEERAENVRKAIACYKAALEIRKKDEYPVDFAMTQNNLGTAYTDLPSATPEERAENVRKAIACYKAALEIRKKDEYPVQYATTQNNLGTAYTDLPSATAEERAENVRKAIACYKAALEIRKKDEYPVQYATTQNNLGTAYTYLPSATPEERAENVR
ncbi:MAG: tetratricopeptide repeat protein, partial [bacterium]